MTGPRATAAGEAKRHRPPGGARRSPALGLLLCWVGAVLAAAIVGVSGRPLTGTLALPLGYDKLLHAGLFGLLAGIWWLALHHLWDAPTIRRTVLVLVAVAVFGALDEWHQSLVPHRVADLADWFADVGGATLVVLGIMAATRTLARRGAGASGASRPATAPAALAIAVPLGAGSARPAPVGAPPASLWPLRTPEAPPVSSEADGALRVRAKVERRDDR